MTASNRLSLLERTPATARTIFWAFVVATINFGIWALATHAATPSTTVNVAVDQVVDVVDRATSNPPIER